MAITTHRERVALGFGRTDVVTMMEDTFAWLEWHGGPMTGVVTGITTYNGGGTVVSAAGTHSTSCYVNETGAGAAHTCSFLIERKYSSPEGVVEQIHVQRGGHGYTNGQTVTIPAFQMGGVALGAADMTVQVLISNVSYGTTLTWYDSDLTAAKPWGVMRKTIAPNKAYGDTYYGFQMITDTTATIYVGSSFWPADFDDTNGDGNQIGGGGLANSFRGATGMDVGTTATSYSGVASFGLTGEGEEPEESSSGGNIGDGFTVTGSNAYGLDVCTFRSALDPRFAIISFTQPDRPSQAFDDNSYATFFLHDYDSSLWDYDDVFLSGVTHFIPHTSGTSGNSEITQRTYFGPIDTGVSANVAGFRAAEMGWAGMDNTASVDYGVTNSYKEEEYYPPNRYGSSIRDPAFRYYNKDGYWGSTGSPRKGSPAPSDNLPASMNYNAIWNGIPICSKWIPCPYYLPDDFAYISFEYNVPDQDIQQWDTITVSGSEVYTIISASYRNDTSTGRTIGIALCGRTV